MGAARFRVLSLHQNNILDIHPDQIPCSPEASMTLYGGISSTFKIVEVLIVPTSPSKATTALDTIFSQDYPEHRTAESYIGWFWDLLHDLARQVPHNSPEEDRLQTDSAASNESQKKQRRFNSQPLRSTRNAMSTRRITLLDLPSKDPCSSWSRHPLKTRLLLNYKGLDYKTEWTEYPDVKPKIQPHLPPNENGTPYTIPTIQLGDGTWITDSGKIAYTLEKLHPNPSLHLDSPYHTKVEQLASKIVQNVCPLCYSRVPVNLLNEASVEYWYTTRRERLGMTVQEYEEKLGGEAAYLGAEPYLNQMTELLMENDGPFFMGSEASYADFIWVAFLVFFKRVDEGIFVEVLKRTSDEAVHRSLLDACASWLQRMDH
ncbi:Fc.00g025190.m01.CDS01 [Cosmosporella sp. VM-42]